MPRRERRTLPVSFVIVFRGGNCDGESGVRAAMVQSRLTRLCFVRRDAKTDVFVMPVCQIEGGVKSKSVERRDALLFPFRERAFAIAKIFSIGISRSNRFFKGAFFPRFDEMPTAVVFSRLSSVGVFSCKESHFTPSRARVSSHLVSRV